MSQHTKAPWSQGITLRTGQTRKWAQEQIEENDRRERRMVFSGFTAADKGRSRQYVCVCDRDEDARRIVACVNACEGTSEQYLKAVTEEGGAAKFFKDREELLSIARRIGAISVRLPIALASELRDIIAECYSTRQHWNPTARDLDDLEEHARKSREQRQKPHREPK